MKVLLLAPLLAASLAVRPRLVRINGTRFVLSSTGAEVVLGGPNVVVKGPPYMPSVEGTTICNDTCNATACTSCYTFNQADVDHIKSLGWNSIRLGVVWAGAQPRDEDRLDPEFVTRLHAVLNLTDANGIHVVLDNHGDMVGSAGCGNGVPMWIQQQAAPQLIGKPLHTDFPYSLVGEIEVSKVGGYDHCGTDEARWAAHAGDPNYNLLNECCLAMNGPNPGGLGFTTISQATMDYVLRPGAGRDKFVRYWRLMAEAVASHPSAFAAELMNEPMSIRRRWMYDTWRACAVAINSGAARHRLPPATCPPAQARRPHSAADRRSSLARAAADLRPRPCRAAVVPDMSVSICDIGEGTIVPSRLTRLTGATEDISRGTAEWIKASSNVFYAWHYGDPPQSIENVLAIGRAWNVPTFGTETGCGQFDAAAAANTSHSYWHYSSCTQRPSRTRHRAS